MLFSVCPDILGQQFLDWGKTFGGTGYEESNGIATDNENNVYVVGDYWLKCDFDPSSDTLNLKSNGFGTDAYIQKLDSLGNLIWVRTVSGPYHDRGTDIAVSAQGCIYAAGTFIDSADFDPSTSNYIEYSNGNDDLFLIKLDPKGDFKWVKTLGGPGVEEIESIELDDTSNLYVCGNFTDTLDFNPNGTSRIVESKGLFDGFVQKYDSSGNHIWTFTFGSSGFDIASDIAIDKQGNSWVIGYFSNTLTYGSNALISSGKSDVIVAKINPSGDLVFMKQIGGLGHDKGISINLDNHDRPYITGSFENQINLNPNGTGGISNSNGAIDVFLSALSSNGTYRWGHSWGGATVEQPSKLLINSKDQIFCLGQFFDSLDFNPGSGVVIGNSLLGVEGFISEFDTTGNFISFQQYGGIGDIMINDATLNSNEKLVSTGSFLNEIDLDPTHRNYLKSSHGAEDVFIQQLKFDCTATIDTIHASNCFNYLAPSGKSVWTASGLYSDTLVSTLNCDSILVVDLSISNSALDTTKLRSCKAYSPIGSNKLFTQSGLYLDTVVSATGCDSLIIIDLSIEQSSTHSYSTTACGSYMGPSGNNSIQTSGVLLDTISNSKGCDSILTIQATIHPTYLKSISETSCRHIKSPSKKHTWTSSGLYNDTLSTINGCDSIIQVQASIVPLKKGVSKQGKNMKSKQNNGNYQWVNCDSNYALIPNANEQSFEAASNGNYAVIITKDGCSDTSECVNYKMVSIEITGQKNKIYSISPNPFYNTIKISSSYLKFVDLEIINSLGQVVYSKMESKTNTEIELDIPIGLYFIRIHSNLNGQETEIFKIIKH